MAKNFKELHARMSPTSRAHSEAKAWLYYECPVHRGHNEGWPHLLSRARRHLHDNDERAAAVYARAAFEMKLQKYCEDSRVPVPYHRDPRRVSAEQFWEAIKAKLRGEKRLTACQTMVDQLEMFRKVVLNPLSHAHAATVTRVEIDGAIKAVNNLHFPE